MLTALVLGYEVTGKVATAVNSGANRGWHTTPVFGSIGAAAACGKLLRLDVARLQMALGIAASMAGGLLANAGTMTKPLHAGQGARSGVVSAMLAKEGYTANAGILEAHGGFYDVFFGEGNSDLWRVTATLGNPYGFDGMEEADLSWGERIREFYLTRARGGTGLITTWWGLISQKLEPSFTRRFFDLHSDSYLE